jgi:hypothetical protein
MWFQVQNGTDDRHSDMSNVDDCEIIDLCDENPGPSERPVCCHGNCSVETAVTNISCQLVTSAFTQTDGRCTFTDSTTSPINHSNLLSVRHVDSGSSSSDSDSDYDPLKDSQGTLSTNYDSQKTDDNVVTQCRAMTNHLVRSNSQRYLGLPQQFLFLLNSLAGKLPFSGKYRVLTQTEVVEIVLRKVRLNETFDVLADLYGVSKSHISRLFSRCLPILSMYFKDLIIWPTLTEVQKRLPLAFKTRYRNVISIIDCLEIEIQKPAKALEQSLTWSDYKHANTVKYLISCTPDGTINFVSSGYSGRISDVQLVTESDYLNCLQPGVTVMADRGFKSIDTVLQEKGCRLCKPPSVTKNEKFPNELVREAKVVAALRVHVERVIHRIREYSFLAPHTCIPSHLVSLTDYAIVVAAGLVNLQPPLIVA